MIRRARVAAAAAALLLVGAAAPVAAQDAGARRLDGGRFTVFAYPQDLPLARSLLVEAQARDTFPGLPRPSRRVVIAIAPDADRFRAWVGPYAPEWGAAIAFPEAQRIVMQGRSAGSDAGDPRVVLRHELAHLALHEGLGGLAPRWFDEGYASYAAGEWGRDEMLTLNLALALRRGRSFAALDSTFAAGGAAGARDAYALAHQAVAELASYDRSRGLALLFDAWRAEGNLERGIRRAYGVTLDGFEVNWQRRMRRRYGALAVATDLGVVGVALLALLFPLWYVRRRRVRARLAQMVAADALLERREREAAIEALLASIPASADDETR